MMWLKRKGYRITTVKSLNYILGGFIFSLKVNTGVFNDGDFLNVFLKIFSSSDNLYTLFEKNYRKSQ